MSTAFELIINAIECFIIIDFLTRYFQSKFENITLKRIAFLCAWLVAFIELSYINSLLAFEGAAILIPVVIYFVYSWMCLKGRLLSKLFITVFIMSIVAMIAVVTNLAISSLLNVNMMELIVRFDTDRIIFVLITKLLLFYITRIMLKLRYSSGMKLHDWIPLIMIPFISILSMSFLIGITIDNVVVQKIVLCAGIGILITNAITYYLFVNLNKAHRLESQYQLLQQQSAYEKKRFEDANILYQNMKSLRHDIKNHLLIIDTLLSNEQLNKARNYIAGLVDEQLTSSKKILFTENEILNAVVGTRLSICEKEGIKFNINIEHDLNNMNNEDIVVLLGNLLDNAIEASKLSHYKTLQLTIQSKGAYINIFVSNSIVAPVLAENPKLATTKAKKAYHGFGIKNIKKVVEQYNGMIEFFEQDNLFCCDILVKCDQFCTVIDKF